MNEYEEALRSVQGQLNWRIGPSSPPFCVFRNFSNYVYDPTQFNQTSFRPQSRSWKAASNGAANDQTIFYSEHVGDQTIPSGLLRTAVEEDLNYQYKPENSRKNTVLTIDCDGEYLLLHCGGQFMDEIVVRNPYFLDPYHNRVQPISSINLGKGSAIRQIVKAGKTNWGYTTNILARTMNEIFFLRTANVGDMLTRREDDEDETIPLLGTLDPINKWQLPEEIIDLAGSPNDWNYAFALSRQGRMYKWERETGVIKQSQRSIFQHLMNNQSIHTTTNTNNICLEASMHPMIAYVSYDKQFGTVDLRSSTVKAEILYTTSQEKPITTIKQHGYINDLHMISTQNALYLMDIRYPKTYVNKETLKQGYDKMVFHRFTDIESRSDEHHVLDVFMGGTRFGSQIAIHSMDSGGYNASSSHMDPLRSHKPIPHNINYGHMLNAASPFSCLTSVRWKTTGSPIVDTTQACVGLDIVPFLPYQYVHHRQNTTVKHSAVKDSTPIPTPRTPFTPNKNKWSTFFGSGNSSSGDEENDVEKEAIKNHMEQSEGSRNSDEEELDPLEKVYRSDCYESIGMTDPDFNCLIVSQSAIGDLYIQRYLFTSHDTVGKNNSADSNKSWYEEATPAEDYTATMFKTPMAKRSNPNSSNSSSNAVVFAATPATNALKKKNKWAHFGTEDDDNDDEEEEEEEPKASQSSSWKTPTRPSAFKGLSQSSYGSSTPFLTNYHPTKPIVSFSHAESTTYADRPVQSHVPIGVRSPVMPLPGYLSYAIHRWIVANASLVKEINPTRLPINVLAYLKQHAFHRYQVNIAPGLKADIHSLVTPQDLLPNSYPSSSNQYLLFLPEDSAIKTQTVCFFLRDLRLDLPVLQKAPDYQVLSLPPPLILLVSEVIELLQNHLLELQECIDQYEGRASLWEIWKYCLDHFQARIDYPVLRQALLSEMIYCQETIISLRYLDDYTIAEKNSYYSDGHYIDYRPNTMIRKIIDFGDEYGCQCHLHLEQKATAKEEGKGNDFGCGKKDCLFPHRLLYSYELPQQRLQSLQTQYDQRKAHPVKDDNDNEEERIEKQEDENEDKKDGFNLIKIKADSQNTSEPTKQEKAVRLHTDVTDKMFQILQDRWDNQSELAYVSWPQGYLLNPNSTSSDLPMSQNPFAEDPDKDNNDDYDEYYRG